MEKSALKAPLGPSRDMAGLLVGVHLATATVTWLALSKWWLALVLSMAIAASLAHALWLHALRTSRRAVIRVELQVDGAATVYFRQFPPVAGRLLGSSFVSSVLVVLNVKTSARRLPLPILIAPDSLATENFRRLRVWLRWRPLRADSGVMGSVDTHAGHDNARGR